MIKFDRSRDKMLLNYEYGGEMNRLQNQVAGCICAACIAWGATGKAVSDVSGGSDIDPCIAEAYPPAKIHVTNKDWAFEQESNATLGGLFKSRFGHEA